MTSYEIHFGSLADNFTVPLYTIFKTFETAILNYKQNNLTGWVITGSFENPAPGP